MTTVHKKFQYSLGNKQARYWLAFVLALGLLGAQAIQLQHDHDGDIAQHADCSICLKQGSESDALPIVVSLPGVVKLTGFPLLEIISEKSETPLVTRSRGPPLA